MRRVYQLIGYASPCYRRAPFYARRFTDEQMLDLLRQILRERGDLTEKIINANKNGPFAKMYRQRFGGLRGAYRLIGFKWPQSQKAHHPNQSRFSNDEMLDALRKLWRERGHLSQEIINKDRSTPSGKLYNKRFGGLMQAYRLIGFTPKFCRKVGQ